MRKYLPLAPAGAPSVWLKATDVWPTRHGAYRTPYVMETISTAIVVAPGTTLRAWCALLPSDSAVAYVGTTTKLWQYNGVDTFTDRSKGGGYTNTATDWSFAQFGNVTIATNRIDAPQSRDSSGAVAFANLAGTPAKATIVCTQQSQVLLFDLNDGAEKPDYFAACAPGNQTDWSGAGATLPTPIWQRPGRITAAVAFRDYVLVFKRSSIYRLTYTGSTYKWKVELIASGRGAWGKHDALVCGDTVMFSGPGGAWSYDGSTFRPLTDWVGEIDTASASVFLPIAQNAVFMAKRTVSATVLYDPRAYNLVSNSWNGATYLWHLTGGGLNTVASGGWKLMTGEPAAIRTMLGSSSLGNDVMMAVNIGGTLGGITVNAVADSGQKLWKDLGAGSYAWLGGSIEGIGGRTITEFTGADYDYTTTIRAISSDPSPGNTSLQLKLYQSNSKDDHDLTLADDVSPTETITSSTDQRRFDFQAAGGYLVPALLIPTASGHVEVNDYTLRMGSGGEL